MAQITWRNISNSGGSGVATKGQANGIDTIMKAFDPLEETLKNRAALADQNWDARAALNTRDMNAQIRKAQDIGEFNQMQDSGALSEEAFNKQFGVQYNPENRQNIINQRRAVLQDKVTNELLPTALAAADEKSDLLAGSSVLEKGLRDARMREEEIQQRVSSFNKNNEARQALYGKAKKETLISAMADVDFNEHSTVDDVTDQLAEWQDAGLNIDYDAAQNALDKKRIGTRDDWSQEKKIEEYNHNVHQRELRKRVSSNALEAFKSSGGDMATVTENILNSGLDNPMEALANITPALAKMTELPPTEKYKLQMQAETEMAGRTEIKNEQDTIVSTQQEQIDGMLAFPSERLEHLKNNVKTELDVYASHDFENSDIDKANIQEGMDVLQSKSVNLPPQDAAVVMAMTLEQMKGADVAWIQPDWMDGDIEQNFNNLLTKNAIQFRKHEKAQQNLNSLKAGFNKEQRQWDKNYKATIGARLLSASQSRLKGKQITPESLMKDFDIDPDLGMSFVSDTDERVLNYKKTYNEIMNPEEASTPVKTKENAVSPAKTGNKEKQVLTPSANKNEATENILKGLGANSALMKKASESKSKEVQALKDTIQKQLKKIAKQEKTLTENDPVISAAKKLKALLYKTDNASWDSYK